MAAIKTERVVLNMGTIASATTSSATQYFRLRAFDTTNDAGFELRIDSLSVVPSLAYTAQEASQDLTLKLYHMTSAASTAMATTLTIGTGGTGDLTAGTAEAVTISTAQKATYVLDDDGDYFELRYENDDADGTGPTNLVAVATIGYYKPGSTA